MLAFAPRFLGQKPVKNSFRLSAGDTSPGQIPLFIKDSSGLPLQRTFALALIEMQNGSVTAKWSDQTNSLGDSVIDVGSDLANQPTTFVVIPPKSHQLPISLAEATRNPDGSITLEAKREDSAATTAIKYVGVLMAGAGLGILGYLGVRWYQQGAGR